MVSSVAVARDARSRPKEGHSPNMGDHVWLMTSKQTEPLLYRVSGVRAVVQRCYDDTPAQFIDVGVKDLVHETDTGRLERILVWEFYVDLPNPTSEWS